MTSRAEWEQRVAAVWNADDDATLVERMAAVAADAPHPSLGAFELGGAYDSTGREAEALVRYEAAVAGGIADVDPERAAQLVVQHASTLRNVGRVDDAIALLSSAPPHPSTGAAREVFLALALHSAGRDAEALRTAIEALVPTLPRYRRSVAAYARALTD
ncbi:tetratricopeptide repeat protein [Microbacterium betulae]|uniref:Tetratricopeptide repeat protein n=1 Tax=Microbacterium betulae TaxID=2981139 RepID=A0AA97FF57_9MICO|nr:tetratricopeptide repeat protein [Microbacterium sp. AB]WOF21763.1 tetratricopeptide repeat protein [Microbacterium sp. AB]